MEKLKFFVYGTLKEGGLFAKQFDERRVSVKPATTYGTMYSVNDKFPAVIFAEEGNKIVGEIHKYKDIMSVRKSFDNIEGFVEKGYVNNLYNRKVIMVLDNEGNLVKCHTYEFNRPVTFLPKIKSGIWEINDGNH